MISRRFEINYEYIIMSTLILSILGVSIAAQHCSVWMEIAPCKCTKDSSRITITCENMSSYSEVVNTLNSHFGPTDRVILKVTNSTLDDLPQRSFKELNMTIDNIQLHHNNLSELSSYSFLGLTNVNYLSLADNNIGSVPVHILEKVPNVKTLDLGRNGIRHLTGESFKNVPYLQVIMLGGNLISQMEVTSIPITTQRLHLAINKIKDLNGTLTNLTNLEWMFIHTNELTSLENQLPVTATKLVMIHASDNKIEKLPQHLKTYSNLQSLFMHNNMLTSLDGVLSKLKLLERSSFEHNRISVLTKEDFLETEKLQYLGLGNNLITSLNNSISTLQRLTVLNLTHNLLTEFSLQEMKGLKNLLTVDLSYNKIPVLQGPTANLHVQNIILSGNLISQMEVTSIPLTTRQLHLDGNKIKDLNGTLTNLTNLEWIFINANELTSLENQLPVTAPRLVIIHASDNKIERLPQHLKTYSNLQALFMHNNMLTSLDGVLSKLRKLEQSQFDHNRISVLTKEDFLENEKLQYLGLGNNLITSLNNSISTLQRLTVLNLTHNLLTEFSLQEINGLNKLLTVDLSYNKISTLQGPTVNLVVWETNLTELFLNNNDLYELNGALSGLFRLEKLNLSYNKLTQISPDDLIGLEKLKMLDISHNQLTTLEETGKTVLPFLNALIASHNLITELDHDDFNGLPILCLADLSNNQIVALGRDLGSKTRCKEKDLNVILQDNPMLCDAAYPEIVMAMKINHINISGDAHCGPLSEQQPTTSQPNGFPGIIQEEVYSDPDLKANSLYNQPIFKPIPLVKNEPTYDTSNQLTIEPTIKMEHNNGMLVKKDDTTEETSLNSQKGISETFVKINNEPINQKNELPDQELNMFALSSFEQQQLTHKSEDKVVAPLNEKLDTTILQQKQLNQLVTQIEELRLKVEELTIQNKILSHAMNQSTEETNETRMNEDKNKTPEQMVARVLSSSETIQDNAGELET